MVKPRRRVLRRGEEGIAHELELISQHSAELEGAFRAYVRMDCGQQLRAVVPRGVIGKIGLDLGGGEGQLGLSSNARHTHNVAPVRPAMEIAIIQCEQLGGQLELHGPLPLALAPHQHPLAVVPHRIRLWVDAKALLRERELRKTRGFAHRDVSVGKHVPEHLAPKIPHGCKVRVLRHHLGDRLKRSGVINLGRAPLHGCGGAASVRGRTLLVLLADRCALLWCESLDTVHVGHTFALA